MDFKPEELINANERFKPGRATKLAPPIDPVVSKIVGKKVLATDPRLIRLIVKWKGGKSNDSEQPDNYLNDPKKVEELKQTFKYA